MDEDRSWYIVIERWNMQNEELLPYVVGPYKTELIAKEQANDECNVIYSLLTIDAKDENYQAVECYWTQDPPKISLGIIPPEEDLKE